MLESSTVDELLTLTHAALARELEIMQIRSKIATEAQTEMDKSQRDYVLRQQMKAIQKELGEDETGEKAEAEQLRERLEKADLPDDVRKEAERELKRMEAAAASRARLSRHSHLSRIRSRTAVAKIERGKARSERGAEDSRRRPLRPRRHQGTHSRIARRRQAAARFARVPILLFVGPPGVGKTSLGRSIARALGTRIRTHVARRNARRSRASRPSPNIHRRDARPDHSGSAARRRK